jgi:hypothetical protein
MTRQLTIALAACIALLAGCEPQTTHNPTSMTGNAPHTTATIQDWNAFSKLKLAFGHQSVGAQVVSGIEALSRENQIALAIAESREALTAPALHHFKLGINGDPQGKIKDFATAMSDPFAGSADVAFMELCFVDFAADTDSEQLAHQYIANIDQLAARFPHTTFVPVTALLTTVQTGPKALIKKLIGKEPAGYEENARRKVFNDMLRSHYASRNVLFDIAAVESRFGNMAIQRDGRRIEILDPALTSDGGHLNDEGERLVASALVHHIANLAQPSSPGH